MKFWKKLQWLGWQPLLRYRWLLVVVRVVLAAQVQAIVTPQVIKYSVCTIKQRQYNRSKKQNLWLVC